MDYQTFRVELADSIATVSFNRPEKANALHQQGWDELKAIFEELDQDSSTRVIILQAEGKHFCAGIDLSLLMDISQVRSIKCEGRRGEKIRQLVLDLQAPINAIEQCRKPVIAAIHGGCVGGGLDIVAACDMRYATEDAYFTVKEIDMGMVADLGVLQRLPKIIPEGKAREMAYTGRKVSGKEASGFGLVNEAYSSREELHAAVRSLAETIVSKSPLSIRGTKSILNHTRDHSVADGLEYVAVWNAAMLLSEDLMEAFQASMQKKEPVYKD
ncbi:MAG: crotonase/enoyl-CoA hydratase family protein [Bacteroidota bacterium]